MQPSIPAPTTTDPVAPVLRHPRALVPVLVSLGMLVAVVSSLGAPLIPTIAAEDHVAVSTAQWALTVTMLVGAVATPVMGRLGDGPHRKRVILGGLTFVLVGSLLAALPLGFACLLVGRALQGVGMGLVPLAIATARDALPAARARSAVATLSLTTAAGIGLGYPITGMFAEYLGMYAGFWFAAATAAAALTAAVLVVPRAPLRPGVRMDLPGALLLACGMAALLMALAEGERWGWGSLPLIALAAAAVLLLAGWVGHSLRSSHPLVQVRQVKDRGVLVANLTTMVGGVGTYLLIALVTRYVQTPDSAGYGFGASIVVTGLLLVPFSAASLVTGRLVGLLGGAATPGRMLPLGCLLSLGSLVCFLLARSSLWGIGTMMALAGLGVGVTFAVTPGLIVAGVPAAETGSAMSFNQVVKYIGYSTGSALSAVVLQAATAPGASLPGNDGYRTAGLVGCAAFAVTGVLAVALTRGGLRPRPSVVAAVRATPAGAVDPAPSPATRSGL
ncbi:MFS transporter [Streptomyces sp. VRA16 Mangrove soil]|uniref:MFS transporter n=1 Tax=Streptomyces sp. VRA16 Mangrove soil TaxID=2817434 RepID=UPI0027DD68CC|nr:MFS transporter [Streptomyces sp. VRA16 Mangrove soil]